MPRVIAQAAALALVDGRICLVASSNGRRWVLPKGWIDPGYSGPEAARQEAWEEAGLIGTVEDRPLGRYDYIKNGDLFQVTIFPMDVSEIRDSWPEDSRRRVWVRPDEAARMVEEPVLAGILNGIEVKENDLSTDYADSTDYRE